MSAQTENLIPYKQQKQWKRENRLSIVNIIFIILFGAANLWLAFQMLETTQAINKHIKSTDEYNAREKEKAERAVLAFGEIITDDAFAFFSDVDTAKITAVRNVLEERGFTVGNLTEAQTDLFRETNNKVFYYSPSQDSSGVWSIALNLAAEDYSESAYCFSQNINRVDVTNYGEYANYMLINSCRIDYAGNRFRILKSTKTPIKLTFDSDRKASFHLSVITANFVDDLCDVKKLDKENGIFTVGSGDSFFNYKKITFNAEMVNVYNVAYPCNIVIEVQGNGMIAYMEPRTE